MTKQLLLPGGVHEVKTKEEEATEAINDSAVSETIQRWAEAEDDCEVMTVDWEGACEHGAANEVLQQFGLMAPMFAAARIMRYQFENKQAPKTVQLIVQVIADNEPVSIDELNATV